MIARIDIDFDTLNGLTKLLIFSDKGLYKTMAFEREFLYKMTLKEIFMIGESQFKEDKKA